MLVVDPAQALYGFRGANADALRDMARFGEPLRQWAYNLDLRGIAHWVLSDRIRMPHHKICRT